MTYNLDDGDGNAVTAGVQDLRTARRFAVEYGATVAIFGPELPESGEVWNPAPDSLDVRDRHGGLTIETFGPRMGTSSLWRSAQNRRSTIGTLIPGSPRPGNYQGRECLEARYRIPAYRFDCIVWLDNATGERIA